MAVLGGNKMLYAKSEPIETIKEHTDKLLNNLKILQKYLWRKNNKNNQYGFQKILGTYENYMYIS